MTTEQKIIFKWVIVAIIFLAIIIFWKPISKAIGIGGKPEVPTDGTGCTTDDGRDGIYANGICTATGGPRPTGPNGGIGTAETERTGSKKTHCIPRQLGAQCQPRIYVNGHWFAIDAKNTTATTCCYTLIN